MTTVGGIAVQADLRGAWVGVRDQGSRPTCLACAVSDAHAHAHNLTHRLSAEYLYYIGVKQAPLQPSADGLTLADADRALRKAGQPNEIEWPYQPKTPDPWAPPPVSTLWFGGLKTCGTNSGDVVASLRAGFPVVLGLRIVRGFMHVQAAPHIVDTSGKPTAGHAVLGVGLGASVDGGAVDLVLIRNSWGFAWGDGGYAWLPLTYLTRNLIGARTLVPLPLPVPMPLAA